MSKQDRTLKVLYDGDGQNHRLAQMNGGMQTSSARNYGKGMRRKENEIILTGSCV